jgi:hypothetical protein
MSPQYIAYQKGIEWNIITECLKRRSRRNHSGNCVCEDCGTNACGPLQVHHLTYQYLYSELDGHLDTVILIGRECHQMRHPERVEREYIEENNQQYLCNYDDVKIEFFEPKPVDPEAKAFFAWMASL